MKIIWLTYDLPYPPNSGGKQRAYYLLKYLGAKHDITLFSYFRKKEQLNNIWELKKLVSDIRVFPRRPVWDIRNLILASFCDKPLLTVSYLSEKLAADLKEELTKFNYDLVHLEFFGMSWVLPLVKRLGIKVVFGGENIEYEIYRKYALSVRNPFLRKIMEFDVSKMKRLEEKTWRLADANLAVCQSDLEVMKKSGAKNCYLVPNGVDSLYYKKFAKKLDETVNFRALFTGNLNYPQNSAAVRWFLDKVMPLVKKSIPEFKLVLVSGVKPNWLSYFSSSLDFRLDQSSDFTVFVEEADIYILPIWIKSGTNIKLLQAMATGFPIVSTPPGVSGYNFTHGRELLIADTAEDFAESIIKLMMDFQLRQSLSSQALKRAADYDWSKSAEVLERVYENI